MSLSILQNIEIVHLHKNIEYVLHGRHWQVNFPVHNGCIHIVDVFTYVHFYNILGNSGRRSGLLLYFSFSMATSLRMEGEKPPPVIPRFMLVITA